MKIDLNILSILVFFLIANGFFAALILILKRENKRANPYLAMLAFLLSLWLGDTFFRLAGIYQQAPGLYFLPIYFSWGFGALIYFYTLQLTSRDFRLSGPSLLHFLPPVLQGLFYIFLRFKDYGFRREFWLEVHRPFTYDLELGLSFALLLIYLIMSRRQMIRYRKQIENSFSELSRITLRWLNQLHMALFVLSLFWLLETLARLVWNFYFLSPFSAITIGLLILLIAIGGILQRDLSFATAGISSQGSVQDQRDSEIEPKELERIQEILAEQELFLIPDLSLKDFSEKVGLSARETSRLINSGLNMSFVDFINASRIRRFKDLAQGQNLQQLSLLGLAYESGFNSKSTFNRVFKKMEGKSPSVYLKEA